jgi:hypothetical protein
VAARVLPAATADRALVIARARALVTARAVRVSVEEAREGPIALETGVSREAAAVTGTHSAEARADTTEGVPGATAAGARPALAAADSAVEAEAVPEAAVEDEGSR